VLKVIPIFAVNLSTWRRMFTKYILIYENQ